MKQDKLNRYLFIFIFFLALSANAQTLVDKHLSFWPGINNQDYIYDIVEESNDNNIPETKLKEELYQSALKNLSRKIQIHVKDFAEIKKESVDALTHTFYKSQTNFITDLELRFVKSDFIYDSSDKRGYLIAYINKTEVCQYYLTEFELAISNLNQKTSSAEKYLDNGYKIKAINELDGLQVLNEKCSEALSWLNIFGYNDQQIYELNQRLLNVEAVEKDLRLKLEHDVIIYLNSNVSVFDKKDNSLGLEIKGLLSEKGCSFTENPSEADWVIEIKGNAREYSTTTIGSTMNYISYVDITILIKKQSSSQIVYEDMVSSKGIHPMGYGAAANKAFMDLPKQIENIIAKTIDL